jgi:hypothetical protein
MGRRCGVEASVNTSLNVAGPIVQTPQHALDALRRSRAMDGVVLIGAADEAFLASHTATIGPKDGGPRLGGGSIIGSLASGHHGGGATLIGLRLPEGRVSFRPR